MIPRMADRELNMFDTYIKKSKHYYEYGMGGSTVYVYNNTDTTTIEGVDSSKTWINKIANICTDITRFTAHHVDIGKTKKWGYPCNKKNKTNWVAYSNSINLASTTPDVILVDGRFRVACIAMVILNAIQRGSDPAIILHDATRPRYEPARKMLHLVDSSDTLHVYKIKTRDLDEILHVYDSYKYITL